MGDMSIVIEDDFIVGPQQNPASCVVFHDIRICLAIEVQPRACTGRDPIPGHFVGVIQCPRRHSLHQRGGQQHVFQREGIVRRLVTVPENFQHVSAGFGESEGADVDPFPPVVTLIDDRPGGGSQTMIQPVVVDVPCFEVQSLTSRRGERVVIHLTRRADVPLNQRIEDERCRVMHCGGSDPLIHRLEVVAFRHVRHVADDEIVCPARIECRKRGVERQVTVMIEERVPRGIVECPATRVVIDDTGIDQSFKIQRLASFCVHSEDLDLLGLHIPGHFRPERQVFGIRQIEQLEAVVGQRVRFGRIDFHGVNTGVNQRHWRQMRIRSRVTIQDDLSRW